MEELQRLFAAKKAAIAAEQEVFPPVGAVGLATAVPPMGSASGSYANMGTNITVRDHSECPVVPGTVHLKGFKQRIDWTATNLQNKAVLLWRLAKLYEQGEFTRLVFDGDDLNKGSYSALVPEIAKKCPTIEFVAFLEASREKGFIQSWARINLPMTVYLCPELPLDQLGLHALTTTEATLVICFGGEDHLQKEFAKASSAVKWLIVPATRPKSTKGDVLEECKLAAVIDDRLTGTTPQTDVDACDVHCVSRSLPDSRSRRLSGTELPCAQPIRRRASAAWAGQHTMYYNAALVSACPRL
jgi:hypothetical protein